MELEVVKGYIRIDHDEDDNLLLLFIKAAEEYITSSIGECDFTKARIQILALNYIATLYENRSFTEVERESKANFMCRTLMTQLRLEYGVY